MAAKYRLFTLTFDGKRRYYRSDSLDSLLEKGVSLWQNGDMRTIRLVDADHGFALKTWKT